MQKQEANILLQRIKTFYPKFFYASYTVENWYMELKDYNPNLLVQALRQYAEDNNEPPSVMNLKTIADRIANTNEIDYETLCKYCGRLLDKEHQVVHEDRCRSIRYMGRKYETLFNRAIDKRQLWELSKEEFDKKYDEFLKYIEPKVTKPNEKFFMKKYFESEVNE